MKLPIKHEFYVMIRAGLKTKEWRDAHITFIDEKTGDAMRIDVDAARVVSRDSVPELKALPEDVISDENVIEFSLRTTDMRGLRND